MYFKYIISVSKTLQFYYNNNDMKTTKRLVLRVIKMSEWDIGVNVIYQQFIAMYDSGCQICYNWSSLKLVFKSPEHTEVPHRR